VSTLHAALALALGWFAIAAASLVPAGNAAFARRIAFPLGALVGLALAAAGLGAVWLPVQALTLPLGLPDLPFHVRLDPLAGFFLMLLGSVAAGVSVYAAGYFREEPSGRLALVACQYHVFLSSMAFVVLADDAYLFMVAWETMALASYFLVITDHREAAARSAGFLYLLIAHLGAIAILLCFGVLHGGRGDYTFDALRAAQLRPAWATVAFLLAFFGFGAKAGILPLHAWLPEAHPAAPSPVSALMSGVMIKTAIYGMVRVIFDLIGGTGGVRWEWGMLVLVVGAGTMLFGVLYALMQHDLKRLLAYSSVENIGIILLGLGMAMVFIGFGAGAAGTLGLIAALYHTLNHAAFKSLLFLGAGSILHSSGLRNLNDMGGLVHRMPKTAFYFLIGALAISALPPLNGFVSEWLTFQTALQATLLQNGVVRSLVPLFAATLALAGALTAMAFVKVFGVAFLGQPREPAHPSPLPHAGDAGNMERFGMAWLAAGCFVLGLFPTSFLLVLNRVCVSLGSAPLSEQALAGSGWLWLVPTAPDRASYSPVIFLLVIVAVTLLAFFLVRRFFHGRVRVVDPWDCGYPEQTSRMQDTADAFGQPIRHVFGPLYRMERRLPGPDDAAPRYFVKIEDRHWYWLYLPVARAAEYVSSKIALLQQGRISIYLLYSFITLIALLVFVR
jgi:formate hydrogenlyase subunit 3/multisubunit Na+/H+ antiporter MnhD subunit